MRHQPTLRKPLISAFVKIGNDLFEETQKLELNHVSTIPIRGVEWKKPEKGEKQDMTLETSQSTEFETVLKNWDPSSSEADQAESPNEGLMVVNIRVDQVYGFEMAQDSSLLSSDFLLMFSRIAECILSNSNASDNGNVMLECDLPSVLLHFFLAERPIFGAQNNPFISSVASVFKLLLVS